MSPLIIYSTLRLLSRGRSGEWNGNCCTMQNCTQLGKFVFWQTAQKPTVAQVYASTATCRSCSEPLQDTGGQPGGLSSAGL